MGNEAPLQDRKGDREAQKKKHPKTGTSGKATTKSRIATAAAFGGGALAYGLLEGCGFHLWEPASAAIAANPWTWPGFATAPVVALGFTSPGRARICAVLRWLILKIEGGL